jgi:hypothetical protein
LFVPEQHSIIYKNMAISLHALGQLQAGEPAPLKVKPAYIAAQTETQELTIACFLRRFGDRVSTSGKLFPWW